ncbi:uncharacterized protein Nmag_0856 [Natrialba magadii ATCC 43099]|uniref:Uncharacterized protein n=1 Tax=Natrialba magadii (strain ATCC 43099 / DSM 3394 / CCM 3739 / CIP 104546 / IAM 13178 / JCM 8861 / NBRC 102185 / NCIMB 2190 / MS3) TaxID=547559 RepID=D3T082_NATMM|nr:hypothetical protein [Natrialba magadii]ADD04440.1 uncharacterized protein Nmag_0856 [Natrialba magadii ATCC 43099]
MNRRQYLASATGVAIVGLSGCLQILASGEISPSREPESVPSSLDCNDNDFDRLSNRGTGEVGDAGSFSLRVNDTSFRYGDTVEITLRNTSFTSEYTATRDHYNFLVYTDAGWEEVRGVIEGNMDYIDVERRHRPGTVYEWTFELTDSGLVDDDDVLTVCPSLSSGRYRFVYFGTTEPVAVEFDLYRDDQNI